MFNCPEADGRMQGKGRLLEINKEGELNRCIALVCMCAKVNALAACEIVLFFRCCFYVLLVWCYE